jgi:hypothetical protein
MNNIAVTIWHFMNNINNDSQTLNFNTDSRTLKEIQKRRTFAIISHPDAGKTTLTEKLLLFGGAIQQAGAVKSRKTEKKQPVIFSQLSKKEASASHLLL